MNFGRQRESWAWFVRSSGSWRWLVASVLGLLEAREKRVREEIARLREEAERVQAALGEAEGGLQRLVDARVTVAEVLAEPPSTDAEPARGAMTGSPVPHRAEGMEASVLAPDYQRIVSVLESEAGREGMRCQQLAAVLGLRVVPAKVEGLRSKAKRLVERGVGSVGAAGGFHRAGGADRLNAPGRRPARPPLMSMVIDHSTMASCMAGSVS